MCVLETAGTFVLWLPAETASNVVFLRLPSFVVYFWLPLSKENIIYGFRLSLFYGRLQGELSQRLVTHIYIYIYIYRERER